MSSDMLTRRSDERTSFVSDTVQEAREAVSTLDACCVDEIYQARLKQVCQRLLQIAQKYVPKTALAYNDSENLVKCAKLLHSMGLPVEIAPGFAAKCDAVDIDEIVVNSVPYRKLKHRAVAGLSTLADMTEKSAATGSKEYQRGVREGYRRASDIASMFLEDIQNG